jgi:vancomycin resistance protein VanJ
VKLINSIVTICTSLLVLYLILNACASLSAFESVVWLQLLPSFDLLVCFFVLVMLIVLIAARLKRLGLLIVFFLLTAQLLLRHSNFSFPSGHRHSQKETLKVLSLNVGQFSNDTTNVQKCVSLILKENPDIVCLQEFGLYYKWPDTKSVAKDFAQKIDMEYHDFSPKQGNIFGTAFFSKHQILAVDTVFQLLSHTNEAKVYSIKVIDDTISIANVHLQSYNLLSEKYSWSISTIEEAISLRSRQTKLLLAHGADVIVGDFNASPGTIVHRMLCDEFLDVQFEYGNALNPTHKVFPTRLDYIFMRDDKGLRSFHISEEPPSDHKGLVATIHF